jgi:hypothetical protein
MLLRNHYFYFVLRIGTNKNILTHLPCSGMTPKDQTVQGERVLLKLGIWRVFPLFLQVVSCGSIFCVTRNLWEGSNRTDVPLQKGSLTRDIPSIGDSEWLAAVALLVPPSYPSSSWGGLTQQPYWALFWLGAHVRAPGNSSWSIQTCGLNSSGSCTSGSLWGIFLLSMSNV